MNKKFWLIGVLIIVIVVFLGVTCFNTNRVNMKYVKEADVCFIYENTDVLHRLDNKELELVKSIFNGKNVYKDNLSCGFSKAISIKFNDEQTFCIARDTCPIVYWKEKNRYIWLTDDEKTQLYNLLEPYGFIFPCV